MTRTSLVIGVGLVFFATLQIAAQQPLPAGMARAGAKVTNLLPGIKAGAGTMIQGNALNSSNGALPESVVRLRDARSGRIVDTQLTDQSGLFAFKVLDPGSYIIEIVSQADSTVMAASQLINVGAGEAVSAVVKLPFRIPPFAGLLGHTTAQAIVITASAATSGILTTVIALAEPLSP
jgi:hypothetical protein